MLVEVDLRRRRRMRHSPYKQSSDGLLNGKDQKMAILVIKQQNCRKQVVTSAVGTVGGPGPHAHPSTQMSALLLQPDAAIQTVKACGIQT